MKTAKPEKIGTVWTSSARIQFIDLVTNKWVTIDGCIDTPNAINTALSAARKTHPGKTLWVNSTTNGRYIP